MAPTVQDILEIIETIAPADLAESWDNTGLMIGDPSSSVHTILVGLDPTMELLDEARSLGANLIITHHPVIFHPLTSIHPAQQNGRFINAAIREQFNVIGCHTNLDSAANGVSDTLARQLGLSNITPLAVHDRAEAGCGLGRIGSYTEPLLAQDFIDRLKSTLNPPWLLSAGPLPDSVEKVAVCGGSCSELAEQALLAGAQVFVTAEVKDSVARWAEDVGFWIIDGGHFATENSGIRHLAELLTTEMTKRDNNISVKVTTKQTSPLILV